MAEVIGIIAAIAGVADVGCKVSVLLYKYGHAVAHPDKVVASIEPEVSLISAVLRQLESSLRDDENVRLCKVETLKMTEEVAVACRKALKEVEDLIRDFFENKTISMMDRLRRYHVEKKVNLLRADLDRLKSTLILMLEIIKYARSIMKHENKHKERDREILLALQKANVDATLRYQGLLRAIENNESVVGVPFSRLGNIPSYSEAIESSGKQYAVVDKNGIVVSGQSHGADLFLQLETISQLINKVEETQKDTAHLTEHSGIWEAFVGAGEQYFRHTSITRHPKMPGIEKTRGLITQQHSVGHKAKPKDVYIALMGSVGSGKSSFVNLCCGENLAEVSRGPGHCTEDIGEYHFMYTPEVRVHLIDTPGFDDAHRSEREILTDLVEWRSKSHGELTRLSGILYFHSISNSGMHSSAHRNLRMFEKLCGADPAHSIILVTTNWDFTEDQEPALLHEQELQTRDDYWGLMVKRGSSVVRHGGDNDSAMRVLGASGLLGSPDVLPDHHAEPVERKRGFSESGIEFQSAEQKVDQLLAEYTTVLDMPPPQHRRWTMDTTY